MPSSLPFSSGSTRPIAFAAPVEVGIRLIAAARARRRSLCGMSWRPWSCVYAWIVVMKPCSIPKASLSTFASGAEAVRRARRVRDRRGAPPGRTSSSLTPSTSVTSGSVAGAEMTTFFAPASMCFCAPSRSVKNPVDSSTTSTPRSPQGSAAGSRSESSLSSKSPARIVPSPSETSSPSGPSVESYRSRCAIVFGSPRSFAATISKSPPRFRCDRKKLRPMRPKPLMPTRIFAMSCPLRCLAASLVARPSAALSSRPQSCTSPDRPDEAGRRGSSEDDPPLRLHRAQDRAGRRGLNPPADERGPTSRRSMKHRIPESYMRCKSCSARLTSLAQAPVRGGFRRRRPAFRRQLAQRARRVAQPQLGDLAERRREPRQRAVRLELPDRADLCVGGAARRGRGSRGRRSRPGSRARAPRRRRVLVERQRRVARAGERERRRRSAPRPSRRRSRAGRGRGRGAATSSCAATQASSSAPARLAVRISRCGDARPARPSRRRGARRAGRRGGSTSRPTTRFGGASSGACCAREHAGLVRALRARACRRPRGAGTASRARRRGACTCGSRPRRRTPAAARTARRATADSATSRWTENSPCPSRCRLPAVWKSPESSASRSQSLLRLDRRRARGGRPQRAACFELQQASLVVEAERCRTSRARRRRRRGGTGRSAAAGCARRSVRPRAARSAGRRAPRARRSVTVSPYGTAGAPRRSRAEAACTTRGRSRRRRTRPRRRRSTRNRGELRHGFVTRA